MRISKLLLGILFLSIITFKSYSQTVDVEKNVVLRKDTSEQEKFEFPRPIGFVNDFEEVFNTEQRSSLERILSDYEKTTTRQIVVVTIDSIKPYDNLANYATDLSNDWGVGDKETNNGLTIVFSINMREIRISTGLGTEKILTDEICKKILDQTIIPEFKKGKPYDGIEKGIAELMVNWI